MKNKVRIGRNPMSNVIYSGRVNYNNMWVGETHDVTEDAVSAVAHHLLIAGEMLQFEHDGENFVLKVEKYEAD